MDSNSGILLSAAGGCATLIGQITTLVRARAGPRASQIATRRTLRCNLQC